MSKSSTLTVTKDFTRQFNDIIKKFKNDRVLVGIPESTAARKDGDPINNAALLAIHNFGSPANHIPARPVMDIGIRNAEEAVAEEFSKAAKGALDQGVAAVELHLNRAGMIAANSIKKAINSQEGIEPPAGSTLAARKARGFKGEKALIVSAQMRNAITYVLRSG